MLPFSQSCHSSIYVYQSGDVFDIKKLVASTDHVIARGKSYTDPNRREQCHRKKGKVRRRVSRTRSALLGQDSHSFGVERYASKLGTSCHSCRPS
jgi:hypothetical protein